MLQSEVQLYVNGISLSIIEKYFKMKKPVPPNEIERAKEEERKRQRGEIDGESSENAIVGKIRNYCSLDITPIMLENLKISQSVPDEDQAVRNSNHEGMTLRGRCDME